jgi:hypothetical protein
MSTFPLILAVDLDGGGGQYAAMLAGLLPPGRAWRLIPGSSTFYSLLEGCALELDRLQQRVVDLFAELNPTTATELLPEYETDFGLVAAPTIAERRANIQGRRIRRQRFRPADFQLALAPLLALAPASVVVIERTIAQVAAIGDQREIYAFFVYRDPTLPGTYFLASAQALVDAMDPQHTTGTVIESVSMLYDDPHSLYDRDLLGA